MIPGVQKEGVQMQSLALLCYIKDGYTSSALGTVQISYMPGHVLKYVLRTPIAIILNVSSCSQIDYYP